MCHLTHLPFIFAWKNSPKVLAFKKTQIKFGFLFVYRTSGFAEGTCIQENSNKVWFSLHLIVPLASLNGNKGYNKAVCCYATDGSTAARIEEKVD